MPGAIFFTLKDKDETVSLVLSVPTEYKVAQLLTEVIEAVNLSCREVNGGLIRYTLQRQTNQEILAAHVNFGHSQIMQGETVYLTRSISPRGNSPSQNGQRHAVVTAPPKSFVYPLEALRLQAVGDFEQAILVLLHQYHQTIQNIRASNPDEAETLALGPESQLAMLVNEITALFLELIEEQYKNTFYEEFYNLLQDEHTRHFFEAHPDIQERLTTILLQSSYRLAQAKRYQNAHDFAALALQIEPKNEQAETLEALCQQYLNLLSSEDEEERLELARYIAETDPDFGNIAEDVKRLDSAARGSAGESQPLRATSRPSPGTAYVPSLEPYAAEVENHLKPQPKSSFNQIYVWLMSIFGVLMLLALIFWIVTT